MTARVLYFLVIAIASLTSTGSAQAYVFGRDLTEKELATYGPGAVSGYTLTGFDQNDEFVFFQGDAKALNQFVADRAKGTKGKLTVFLGSQGGRAQSPWNDARGVRADWSAKIDVSAGGLTVYVYAEGRVAEEELSFPENVEVRRSGEPAKAK